LAFTLRTKYLGSKYLRFDSIPAAANDPARPE